ncbi:hypothetical protein ENUP19_0037G0012 [Entamoeba nuttalli]|uniref:Zinc finger protein 622, putative n=2 Tax=Entamoeba nuttalli TaxID=412467 RepID=K2GYK4_ENTNP|nr:zinc finger protein 622, putative [Entamoeba nuttalli P19]EKE40333.1 zinc finger protein 622, putative [Entamoeba nuttalli P19]|eukprot:XP_008857330.1 zinc finger protein 622, putative [Entamoeba nuttalli P19]
MSSPLQQKFICSTCCIQFSSSEERATHFKSDYHVFNMKRKAVLMEPVSLQKYKEIMAKDISFKTEECSYYCSLCKKRYNTENQMKEHELSKKHKINVKKNPQKAVDCIKKQTVQAEEEEDLENIPEQTLDEMIQERKSLAPKRSGKHCLFCGIESQNTEENLTHMEKEHSFFIPNIECCCDINGLLNYLHDKICIGYLCIWCSGETSSFHSYESVRQHMIDVCHCKMRYDDKTIEEYDDYYDYSSVPDPIEIIDMDDTSMTLSNGMTIGHRSMANYYKQAIKPVETRACVLANQGRSHPQIPVSMPTVNQTIGSSKALMALPEKTYSDYVKSILRRQMVNNKTHRDQQQQYRKWTKLGIQGNKLFKPVCQTNV